LLDDIDCTTSGGGGPAGGGGSAESATGALKGRHISSTGIAAAAGVLTS
jgi:hypothetical protein